mgnify:CR=1 FL=1
MPTETPDGKTVKRWTMLDQPAEMVEEHDGEYVLASDYDALMSSPAPDLSALWALLDALLDVAQRAIRPLDCGAHYCRYCPAGTKNGWQHGPNCPYEKSQKDHTEAQRLIRELRSVLAVVPAPSPAPPRAEGQQGEAGR